MWRFGPLIPQTRPVVDIDNSLKEENRNCFGSEAFVELENRVLEYGSAAATRVSKNASLGMSAVPMPPFRYERLFENHRANLDR